MRRDDLRRELRFAAGSYTVKCDGRPLISFTMDRDDGEQSRGVPSFAASPAPGPRVWSALVRAGCRHPGLDEHDLARLHALALEHRHVEIFTDLNAVTTGLLGQVVRSLGRRVARVVVASSAVDVLHEYADANHDVATYQPRVGDVARAISLLVELRHEVPVHVHQLPPGTTRFMRRVGSDVLALPGGVPATPPTPALQHDDEDARFVTSEDRQMIAAYWDYLRTGVPRLPVVLLTSDHALAQTCAMERVPFCFALSPLALMARQTGEPLAIDALWLDAASLRLRFCLAQDALFELATVFRTVDVTDCHNAGQRVRFDPHRVRPGHEIEVVVEPLVGATEKPLSASPPPSDESPRAPGMSARIEVSIGALLKVVPRDLSDRRTLNDAGLTRADMVRRLRQAGEETQLIAVTGDEVVAGAALPDLLRALTERDYDHVNQIFRRVKPYDRYLESYDHTTGRLPADRSAAPGWAVTLGAAYKLLEGGLLYGLSDVTDDAFAAAVREAHAYLSGSGTFASLPLVLDRVCRALRMSPIRAVVQLERSLGPGQPLQDFEVQRAKRDDGIPKAHDIIQTPRGEDGYRSVFTPCLGVEINGVLVGTLVSRQPRGTT